MPYNVYLVYERSLTVDADSEEEAVKKAMDIPLYYEDLYYTGKYETERWEWADWDTKEEE